MNLIMLKKLKSIRGINFLQISLPNDRMEGLAIGSPESHNEKKTCTSWLLVV